MISGLGVSRYRVCEFGVYGVGICGLGIYGMEVCEIIDLEFLCLRFMG